MPDIQVHGMEYTIRFPGNVDTCNDVLIVSFYNYNYWVTINITKQILLTQITLKISIRKEQNKKKLYKVEPIGL